MISGTLLRSGLKSPTAEAQLNELRADTLRITVVIAGTTYTLWHLWVAGVWTQEQTANPQAVFSAYQIALVAVPLLLATVMLRHRLLPASLVFIGGMLIAIGWAVWVLESPYPALLYPVVALLAAFVLHPAAGFVTGGIGVATLFALEGAKPGLSADVAWLVAIFALIATFAVWTLMRHMFQVLNWYVDSYNYAESQMREARDHRGELVQAWSQLDLAYVQIERINEELDRARRAADEARRLKAEFAASISHELRTPLNLIVGFSEMMVMSPATYGRTPLPDSYRGDIEAVYRNAAHLSSLVDDVLDLSKIDARRMGLQRGTMSVAEVIDEAVAAAGTMFRDKGLSLDVRLPADLPELYADRTRIRQVIINLLNNAARFTSRGGVTIGAVRDERDVVLWLTDTGAGIPAEDLAHVFDEFHQASGDNWRRTTGLGLTISKRFVEMHGGNMWVESVMGEGTTFYFSLPVEGNVVSAPARDEWQPWLPQPGSDAPRPAVLLLSDDPEAARVFHRYLDGYEVITSASASLADRVVAGSPVQAVIVSDSGCTPDARALSNRLSSPPMPVIECPIRGNRVISRELGVMRFLTKPVTAQQIGEVLRELPMSASSVLVVDDDPEMVRFLTRVVQMEETSGRWFRARAAADGSEALRLMADETPDLVLLDLLMPGLDGYGVLDQMRANPDLSGVPVALVTAKGADETMSVEHMRIERPGGLSVGELMMCLVATLGALAPPVAERSAPEPRSTTAG